MGIVRVSRVRTGREESFEFTHRSVRQPASRVDSFEAKDARSRGSESDARHLGIKTEYARSKETPDGGTGEGIEVWRPGPGGYSVIEEYREKNAQGEIYGFVSFWWDADLQGQRFVWCHNTNPLGCELSKGVAKWEGNRLAYREEREENGKKMIHLEVFEDITPASFSQTLSEGPAGRELKRVLTIRAVKLVRQ